MEALINNIKENAKITINGKEYIVKTKTLYGIEEDLADIIDINDIKISKE